MLAAVQRPISPGLHHRRRSDRPLWRNEPTWFLVAEQDRDDRARDPALHGGSG